MITDQNANNEEIKRPESDEEMDNSGSEDLVVVVEFKFY